MNSELSKSGWRIVQRLFGGEQTADARVDRKLSACLAEYTRLWEEVRTKWESQQQLTNQLVYLTAAMVAVSWFILGRRQELNESELAWAEKAWLGIPFLFSTMALLIAYHDRGIRQIASYVYKWLRPRVEELIEVSPGRRDVSSHVWHWDVYWYAEVQRGPNTPNSLEKVWLLVSDFLYSGAKYGLPITVSGGSLLLWAAQADDKGLWWIGFAGAALITGLAIVAGAFESVRYLEIRNVALDHERALSPIEEPDSGE